MASNAPGDAPSADELSSLTDNSASIRHRRMIRYLFIGAGLLLAAGVVIYILINRNTSASTSGGTSNGVTLASPTTPSASSAVSPDSSPVYTPTPVSIPVPVITPDGGGVIAPSNSPSTSTTTTTTPPATTPTTTTTTPPPAAPTAASPTQPTPKQRTYTVQKWPAQGSTLSGIAQIMYGNASLWPQIYSANKSLIGANPNIIQPGMVLTIP